MRRAILQDAATATGLGLLAVAFVGNLVLDPFHVNRLETTWRYALVVPQAMGLTILFLVALRRALGAGGPERAARVLLACAVGGWAWGNWAWTYYNFAGVEVPYPSLADVGYLGFSACAIAGLACLFASERRRLEGVDLALAVAFPLTAGILFYTFLIAGRIEAGAGLLTQTTNLAYPTGDAVYVGLAGLSIFFVRRSALTPFVKRVAVGLLLMAVTDVAFIIGVDRGFYFTGSWIDQMYILAAGAYAWAACRAPAAATAAPQAAARPAPAEDAA